MWGNYSFTNDTATNNISNVSQKAVGFTLPTGSDYTLDSITLRLNNYNTTAGDIALVQIYSDSAKTSSDPNDATLESVTFNNPSSSSNTIGNFNFTPTSAFTFIADTRYWLLVDATAGIYSWRANSPGIAPTGVSGIVNNGYRFSNSNGLSYVSSSAFNSFQINATPVPFDFNPAPGLLLLGGAWVVRRGLKKHSTQKIS